MSRLAPTPQLAPFSSQSGGYMQQNHGPGLNGMLADSGGKMFSVGGAPNSTAWKLEQLKPYFGEPSRQAAEEPYSWWESETYDLPMALRGKCNYVLNILITAILTSDMYAVTEMLPYKKADALSVSWDEWQFTDALLDRTPEESTSRMLTNSFSSYSAHLVRRGKAFMLEHGFWQTPMGMKNWAMNIIQIVNATNETAGLGAAHAIVTATPYVDPSTRYQNQRDRSWNDIDRLMKEETSNWCRIQKEEGGYDTMIANLETLFVNRNGHEPDYLILPAGCNQYVRNRPEENYAYINGRGRTNRDVTKEGNRTVRISRGYRVGEHQPNIDPFYTTVTIGGYHVMNAMASQTVPIDKYHTRNRHIKIFNMNTDNFHIMFFDHHFRYCGLYSDWDGPEPDLSNIGKRWFGKNKFSTWGDLLDAALEKQRMIEKLRLIHDDQYADFIRVFASPFVNAVSNSFQLDFQQPPTLGSVRPMGKALVRIPDGGSWKPSPNIEEFFHLVHSKVVGAGSCHLSFAGNLVVPMIHPSPDSSKATRVIFPPSYAAKLFKTAGEHRMLFDVGSFQAGKPPSIQMALECPRNKDGEAIEPVEPYMVARVQLSVAVSVLHSMLKAFNQMTIKSGSKEPPMLPLIMDFLTWMKGVADLSHVMSTSSSTPLTELFGATGFKEAIDYSAWTPLAYQTRSCFHSLVESVIAVARFSDGTNNQSVIDQLHQTAGCMMGIPQSATKGGFTFSANTSKFVPFTLEDAATLQLSSQTSLDTANKSIEEHTPTIKKAVEEYLVQLAGNKAGKTSAEHERFLEGFRQRFPILLPHVYILLSNNAPQHFIQRALLVAATLPARSLAVQLMQHAVHFHLKKPDVDPDLNSLFSGILVVPGDVTQPFLATSSDKPKVDKFISQFMVSQDANVAKAVTDVIKSSQSSGFTVPVPVSITSGSRLVYFTDVMLKFANDHAKYLDKTRSQTEFKSTEKALTDQQKDVESGDNQVISGLKEKAERYVLHVDESDSGRVTAIDLALRVIVASHSSDLRAYLIDYVKKRYLKTVHEQEGGILDYQPALERMGFMATGQALQALKTLIGSIVASDLELFKQEVQTALFGSPEPGPSTSTTPPQLQSTQSTTRRLSPADLNQLFSRIPLTKGKWAKYSLANNLPFPLGQIGWRLHKQYECATAVMMDAYGRCGYTYFGHADFQLGDDIGKKIHIAHFTLYLKSVVQSNKLIVYARNCISRGYYGGEGVEVWDPLDEDDLTDFKQGKMNKDIIYTPVLSNYIPKHTVLDVTGRFPAHLQVSQVTSGNSLLYDSADIICQRWGITHAPAHLVNKAGRQHVGHSHIGSMQPIFQTLAFQEHTFTWNEADNDYTTVTIDQGHWGPRVYPGCGKVRRGEGRYLERCAWEGTNTFSIAT